MSIFLHPVSTSYIKKHLAYLYHKNTKYFSIVKNNNFVGIYGIVDRGNKFCEIFFTIFEDFRYKTLNKDIIRDMIKCPEIYNYLEIWTWTKLESWVRLFKHFVNDGVMKSPPPFWDKDETKIWYKKRI